MEISKLNGAIPPWIKENIKLHFNKINSNLLIVGSRQKWIDQGQSLNLYNDKSSMKFLNDIYFHAWKSGLKTTYYLRNLAGVPLKKVQKSM